MHAGKEAIIKWLDKQGYTSSYLACHDAVLVLKDEETVLIKTMRDAIEFMRRDSAN